MQRRLFCLATLLVVSALPVRSETLQRVTFNTADGVPLIASYHPAKPGKTTWIFLHGLGSIKEEWRGFADKAAERGFGTLMVDARGHGESVKTATGEPVRYEAWETAADGWAKMPEDLERVIAEMGKRFGVEEHQLGLAGASLGANVALVAASRHPKIKAAVLLSPGMEYAGVSIQSAFSTYGGRPLFVGVSPYDSYAWSTVQAMTRERRDSSFKVAQGTGGAHGVDLLKGPMAQTLIDWMATWK